MKLIILMFVMLNCIPSTKYGQSKVSEYSSPNNTYFNKIKYGEFVLDLNLKLKSDSTYILTSCSQITEGKWKQKNNFIFLECVNKKFIIDSINRDERYSKGKVCNPVEKFEIKNFGLYKEDVLNKKLIKFVLLKK